MAHIPGLFKNSTTSNYYHKSRIGVFIYFWHSLSAGKPIYSNIPGNQHDHLIQNDLLLNKTLGCRRARRHFVLDFFGMLLDLGDVRPYIQRIELVKGKSPALFHSPPQKHNTNKRDTCRRPYYSQEGLT